MGFHLKPADCFVFFLSSLRADKAWPVKSILQQHYINRLLFLEDFMRIIGDELDHGGQMFRLLRLLRSLLFKWKGLEERQEARILPF